MIRFVAERVGQNGNGIFRPIEMLGQNCRLVEINLFRADRAKPQRLVVMGDCGIKLAIAPQEVGEVEPVVRNLNRARGDQGAKCIYRPLYIARHQELHGFILKKHDWKQGDSKSRNRLICTGHMGASLLTRYRGAYHAMIQMGTIVMPRIPITLVAFAILSPAPLYAKPPATQSPSDGKLDRKDPNYIRCVSQVETGSLVKKKRICRTNAEWSKSDGAAHDEADDILSRTRQGFNPNGGG